MIGCRDDSLIPVLRRVQSMFKQLFLDRRTRDTNPAGGAQNLVSMFQTDSVALLVTRWLGIDVTRASGVVVIEDVQW